MENLDSIRTLAFGPVPSRRLGRSLGINNIPPKKCSYSCVYCQLGKTKNTTINRQSFYDPEKIYKEVKKKVQEVALRKGHIDYLTFVSDGEPTLDVNLGKEIQLLKKIKIPIAILSNGSLVWRDDVKQDLMEADLISFKVDAVNENLWRTINKPCNNLKLNAILEGILDFEKVYRGSIISETMLIDKIDYQNEFDKIADFLKTLKRLAKAYIAIPTRPPTKKWAIPPHEEIINMAFQIFSERLDHNRVEYLTGYEGHAFSFTGKVREDLLGIMAVHPMRKTAVEDFLSKAKANWRVVEKLFEEDKIIEVEYRGNVYYMLKII